MVTLRLSRVGSKKRPVYHLVATDSRNRRDGGFIEKLGYFIPAKDVLVLNQDRVSYWVGVGATLSETAKHLIKKSRQQPVAQA
ncbi:MAG: 30S ribosomal protein S16 [Deltaproteobacteria bacterium]|nr:30S ribosomal protein S16 [Deltaproteobacteria bacterium]